MEIINSTSQIIKPALTKEESDLLLSSAKIVLNILGDGSNGQLDTPERIVKSWGELLTAEEPKITVFDSNGYDQMIVDKEIPYYTFCEHHFIPFFGTVKIGYIPDKKIIGLSKLARIVDYYSKRLNTQEYFTQNIANYLWEKLNPKGVGVVVKCLFLLIKK